jgi:hypothetical protein
VAARGGGEAHRGHGRDRRTRAAGRRAAARRGRRPRAAEAGGEGGRQGGHPRPSESRVGTGRLPCRPGSPSAPAGLLCRLSHAGPNLLGQLAGLVQHRRQRLPPHPGQAGGARLGWTQIREAEEGEIVDSDGAAAPAPKKYLLSPLSRSPYSPASPPSAPPGPCPGPPPRARPPPPLPPAPVTREAHAGGGGAPARPARPVGPVRTGPAGPERGRAATLQQPRRSGTTAARRPRC